MTPPPELEAAQLRSENARLRRIQELHQTYGLDFYRPHAKQHKFHICTATSRYGRTGNRFGKSEMGDAEDVAWALGGRIWYRHAFDILDGGGRVVERHAGGANHPLVRLGIPNRPVKGLIIVIDWKKAKEIHTNCQGDYDTWGKLFKLIPKANLGRHNPNRAGNIDFIEIKRPKEFGGGSSSITIATIQSYKNAELTGESGDYDFIHIDEPCPDTMYKAYARGLMDRNGSRWFTCTPLDEMWINDMFTPPSHMVMGDAPDGLEFEKVLPDGRKAGRVYMITGSVHDNPHISEAGKAEFESTLNREERECRLYGRPLALAGAVYREFVYDMHVLADVPAGWKSYAIPPADCCIRVAWDVHGARMPQAILFVATCPDGTVIVYDEKFDDPLIGPTARDVKRRLEGRFVVDRLIDSRALIVNPVTSTPDVLNAIEDEDLFFEAASKDLTAGISEVKEKLLERHVVTKLPTIYFAPHLTETLFEFQHYVYNTETGKPKDKDDHMMENLYRLVLNGLEYVPPVADSDYVKSRPYVIHDQSKYLANSGTFPVR